MKVICIDDDFLCESSKPNFKYINKLPEFGKEEDAQVMRSSIGEDGYFIEGLSGYLPSGRPTLFKMERFTRLSNVDEREQVEQLTNKQ